MTDIHALVEQAHAVGIEFHFYPGGALVFGTPKRLHDHPNLAEDLRVQREDVARYLRAMGNGSAEDRTWIEHYRMYSPPRDERYGDDDIPF